MTTLLPPPPARMRSGQVGFLATLAACCIWGGSSLFFHTLNEVSAFEIVAHRVVWSVLAMCLVVVISGQVAEVVRLFQAPRILGVLCITAFLVTANWTIYIYAVSTSENVQASLGYYIQPLIAVLLGAVVLKERFTPRQGVALALMGLGVVVMIIGAGTVPWLGLALAVTFAVYGLLRKIVPAGSLSGLLVETILLLPFAVGFILWRESSGLGAFTLEGRWDLRLLLMVGTPLWTALPLALFTFGARRLKLSVLGMMQYIGPTIQFIVAIAVFREPFTPAHAAAFALIWGGIAVFSWPSSRKQVLASRK